MPADSPTILATSGGIQRATRIPFTFAPLVRFAVDLSGVSGRAPRICFLSTATGDPYEWQAYLDEAARVAGFNACHLRLFPMPNVDDVEALLLGQDVVWVGGGSVANLLAVWRTHGLDTVFRSVWRAGVVLGGVSAGSICWHIGGTTDSFGPTLQPVTNGLGLVPYANGVHYDSEPQRRPLFQRLIADRVLPEGYATDDGVGLLYRGTELVEAVTEIEGKAAYHVRADHEEERIEPRLLTGARR